METLIQSQPRTLTINPLKGSKSQVVEIPNSLQVLEGGKRKSSNQKMFRILNQEDGDKRIVWDKNDIAELNEAKKLFDTLVEQGMTPYAVDDKGRKATVISEFDPFAEEIVFAPMAALVGG